MTASQVQPHRYCVRCRIAELADEVQYTVKRWDEEVRRASNILRSALEAACPGTHGSFMEQDSKGRTFCSSCGYDSQGRRHKVVCHDESSDHHEHA